MTKRDLTASYTGLVEHAKANYEHDAAIKYAIGGQFDAFGVVERELLRFYGLAPGDSLIDVGCGAGRLSKPLAEYLTGPYLGTDIVPELVEYARAHTARPDWRFEVVDRIAIPAPDASTDMVCFFSVFTHLLHEQSYMYLEEAARVVKPGGRIVFSFLEFAIPAHWAVFTGTLADARGSQVHPLNVFFERSVVPVWASHLGLDVVDLRAGSERFVPLPQPVTMDGGEVMAELGNLGQSIAVLARPAYEGPDPPGEIP